ncbi:LysM peptidoglycan-binding domain-containing M23 family metallopeptidase [Pinisolibacter aquiterrae]|uniref:LysM peptidoglycan-binding domain-containing M23 family metallopeptidase n=1 Tax=Pinisolibacter aquiterrae TaxID=2815579 RepID=UPI001C3DE4D8|nr:LysM peptidoglycan-binding domain-containing M23 family metallopeptidase [Pinisolibacter aquiterrae]MBV5263942.1 LysM peptidoglycan-binding domain-containing M23 family metallopeptidase [Pinisolibacter aquiterrae]MCC8235953.1 LysM peptidoglycan-binding domain-containing M23 family metallopeptidase [Pinisolibacter aquiterrae]
MRPTTQKLRSSNVSRAAILVAAAAVLGGCSSDVGRFGSDPIYTGSTPNQRAILGPSGGEAARYGGNAYSASPSYGRVPERSWSNVDTTGSIEPGSAAVSRSDLTPPPSGAYADTVASPLADAARPAEPAPAYPQVAAAGGWSPQGGTWVTMRQGETIDTLSNRYGVPIAAIRQANAIPAGRTPSPGDRVLIPVYHRPTAAAAPASAPAPQVRQISMSRPTPAPAPAPTAAPQRFATGSIPAPAAAPRPPVAAPAPAVIARAAAPAPMPPATPRPTTTAAATTPPNGGVKLVGAYTVRSGDTLGSIARTYGVSEQALRDRNNLRSASISPGQQLLLPAGTKLMLKTSKAPAAATEVPTTKPAAPVVVAEVKTPAVKAPATTATTPAKPPKDTSKIDQHAAETIAVAREASPAEVEKASSGGGSFRWPVRGRIISEYGAKSNGEKNEGINLAVPEGTSIKAADGGEVIYSGNELKGYGNLVLVRHPNGFVSAYAHASELLVNRGDKVTRGQIIARAGATGSVSQPQLHFELRNGQKAVDPKPYLASN